MIRWKNVEIKIRTTRIIKHLDLQIENGEPLGIIGNNGTGKTILAKAIAGIVPISGDKVPASDYLKKVYVSFQSSFHMRNGFAAFRQQRWNNIDPDAVPTVREELDYASNQEQFDTLLDKFDFKKHLDSFVISLSNGEQRKLELIRALAQQPDILVLDNAFNGLDVESRQLLSDMLNQMTIEGHTFVLTGLRKEDFPSSVNRFILLEMEAIPTLITRNDIAESTEPAPLTIDELPHWNDSPFDELISVRNVSLKYGEKEILKNINWQVNTGEYWILSGANGSGKTSLLNLIFADNPKAYGCDIRLFGKQRGSGESIWDIKKNIGFISPELQQYLPKNQTAMQVICSGLFDSEGLYTKPTSYQLALAKQWLRMFGYLVLAEKLYGELSASAQRIVLIIRTLVKNPPLLLLDEPFQGLDPENIQKMSFLLRQIAKDTNSSMILTTHFRNEIPSFFNKEMKLKNGEIVSASL
jgi:molybdate transport system ATP-binding protein